LDKILNFVYRSFGGFSSALLPRLSISETILSPKSFKSSDISEYT